MSGTLQNRPNGIEPIVAWADMDEASKRYHLAWSHGYLSSDLGGHEAVDEYDDPAGTYAWVLAGLGTVSDMDDLHKEDHAMYEGGGGTRKHFHPGQYQRETHPLA